MSVAVRTFFFENNKKECLVYGNSMEPFLSFGDMVEIVPFTGSLIKGHCYAFINGNKMSLHRYINMTRDGSALFAGDNCLSLDHIALNDIIGEFSSCQYGCTLLIINFINSLFCGLLSFFVNILIFQKLRRQILSSIIGFEIKWRARYEKKI